MLEFSIILRQMLIVISDADFQSFTRNSTPFGIVHADVNLNNPEL